MTAPRRRSRAPADPEATFHEVIERLAPLERKAGEPGEREAAEWIAERLRAAGCDAQVEAEEFLDGYADLVGRLARISAVAGGFALLSRGLRGVGGVAAALAGLGLADDISNGPRLFRQLTAPRKTTWNVVASSGDPAASRTLVILAHHDAATAGRIFDDRAQAWFGEHFPGLLERIDTSVPLWWTALAPPALVALGAKRHHRGLLAAGIAGAAVSAAAFEDIVRRPTVPGANDNLSAVAVLVALAERLRSEPLSDLRVVLACCGAEEVLQGGIYGFARSHFAELDRERTWFLNLETVGSPRLIMVEGEGPLIMEDYPDVRFRDLVARAAERAEAPLRRGMRASFSTDAVVPSRAGYPTATLSSIDRHKSLSNYHRLSDTPDNVDYRTVRHALIVTEAVARELAANPWL